MDHAVVYLRDGRIEIDNNLVENAILYTIIESCRRRGIDPHAYLRDVLTRLPTATNWQVKDLTPQA